MKNLADVQGLLIDIDGVLYTAGSPLRGAVDAVSNLQKSNIKYKFITNTTTRSTGEIESLLIRMGFDISGKDIITSPGIAADLLRRRGVKKIFPLVRDSIKDDFLEFEFTEKEPEYVVVGDIGPVWDHNLMNGLFNLVMKGAKILALHKGRYWQTEAGLTLDIGAYLAGLEYAAGVEAEIVGKPTSLFFNTALEGLGISAENVIMIGDDIDSDIGGAQKYGITGVLVKTGKYRAEYAAKSSVEPDYVAEDFGEVVDLVISDR